MVILFRPTMGFQGRGDQPDQVSFSGMARYHIRVNCIAPGPVITQGFLEAMKKAGLSELPQSPHASGDGKPEEIARVALFLASESSSYIVGETLYVDGGPYRWEGGPEPKD